LPEMIAADGLSDEAISKMDIQTLINSIIVSFDLEEFEQLRVQALMQARAKELGISKNISGLISAYKKKDKQIENKYNRSLAKQESSIPLQFEKNGEPSQTIDNIILIMQNDKFYSGVRYNLLKNAPEVQFNKTVRSWSDTDDAESQRYLERAYSIYSKDKHKAALRVLFKDREYHPIRDIVDNLSWDGIERISTFLTKWMKADDNEYTSEVSRLIFAGGIHRLYMPGCKFDDVPVLIGTSQGEGKSTIVRWLAMHDDYYTEVEQIEGNKGIETLDGAWICEIAELLAVTKTKEQEAVKAYITRQRDKYRKPWDVNPSEYPRRCIFIGTTNIEHFLKDKTGNRRWYPVKVRSSAYWLYDHEQECRDYIVQCWAEAKSKYDLGQMPNYANKELAKQFLDAQSEAMEDDWRVGAIEQFLDQQAVGDYVCVRQIKHDALSPSKDFPQDPTPKESQEISILMGKFERWEKVGSHYISNYGTQRCWRKTGESAQKELPLYATESEAKQRGISARIENELTTYAKNPTIENADKLHAAVCNMPDDWRLKREMP